MSAEVLIPLIVFLTMCLAVLYVLWRVVVTGGDLRRVSQRLRAALDIAARADSALEQVAAAVDELRRRRADGEEVGRLLRASSDGFRQLSRDAATIAQQGEPAVLSALVAELERARRAIELIEHGRDMLEVSGRPGEGETEIKRGYLGILHAREAIREQAIEINAVSLDGRRRGR
jgi:hypothetical protein